MKRPVIVRLGQPAADKEDASALVTFTTPPNVFGTDSSRTGGIATYAGSDGKTLQDSGYTVDDVLAFSGHKGTITTAQIGDDQVTYPKIQNVAASRLLGRATATVGDVEEITLGTNLSFAGTVLNAAGGGGGAGDVVGPASSVTARIATYNGVTGKLIQDGGSTIANVLDRANHTGTQAQATVTNLVADLAAKATSAQGALADTAVQPARSIATTAPLTGGGDLSANRTFAISAATTGAAGSMSAADKTKLDGVAASATANSADATLLARANHTGTQTAATVSDFSTAADARIAAAVGVSVQAFDTQLASLAGLAYAANTLKVVRVNAAETGFELVSLASGGDVSYSGIGATVVGELPVFSGTTGKLIDTSFTTIPQIRARSSHTGTQAPATILLAAANKLVGTTGAAGAASEIDCTAAGRALIDDADIAAQRATLEVPSVDEAILKILADAKGDLIAATGADTFGRLTVGANTHVLTADSTTLTGLKWTSAGSVSITATTITTPYGLTEVTGTITDAAALLTSKVLIGWGTCLDTDENGPDMDNVTFLARPSAGSIAVIMTTQDQTTIGGTFKLNYQLG